MDDEHIRRFGRATRVQTFVRDSADDITPGSRIAALLVELDPIVVKLTGARVGQLRNPVGKQALLEAPSIDFKEIARTSRAIAFGEPGFPVPSYRHPGTNAKLRPFRIRFPTIPANRNDQAHLPARRKSKPGSDGPERTADG